MVIGNWLRVACGEHLGVSLARHVGGLAHYHVQTAIRVAGYFSERERSTSVVRKVKL